MTTTLLERPVEQRAPGNGGVPARRAVSRWAWRLFWREWRQQLLVLAMIVVAVAATFVGAAAATDSKAPADLGFGTARDMATFQGPPTQAVADVALLQRHFGRVDVIENTTLSIPGSIDTYDLRAQDPHGPYGQPMLSLVSGHYPTGAGEVAVTGGVAAAFDLRIGGTWRTAGVTRRVVGIVQNPQSLLDEFALVAPGQVTAPTQTTVLFDAGRGDVGSLGSLRSDIQSVNGATTSNVLNPETIVLTLATLGMLLIALVAVGGFTVLAQRRLRSIGMLGALGATDKNIGLVVRANGLVVGVVGTLLGGALGLGAWLAYRPHLEQSAHHLIGAFALPWAVIVPAMALAVLATYFAASRPARAVTRVPIVSALSGRPAPPKKVHRSALPGVVVLVVSFFLVSYAGSRAGGGGGGGGAPELVLGLVALIVSVVLLSPLGLAALARAVRRAPVALRLATRDLARYRSRSGSALAAISLGVLIAVMICVLAAGRYGNSLDYAGPNLASNQLILYTPSAGPGIGPNGPNGAANGTTPISEKAMHTSVLGLAAALGSHQVIELDTTSANIQHVGSGRQFSGQVYLATPQLLSAFGIKPSQVDRNADVLTMRPGLSGLSDMQLDYGDGGSKSVLITPGSGPGPGPRPGPQGGPPQTDACHPNSGCIANPPIQQISALPAGTSAPNTVITEHAVHTLGLQASNNGWLIQTPQPLTAQQISSARLTATSTGMTVETKNDEPTSAEILNWATVFGVLLALGVLAMTVGLIRSETASDLRILTAAGAGSSTRRSLTAATAGALGLLGALSGTVAGYVAVIAFSSDNSLDGLSSLGNVPVRNLLVIVLGMPLLAAAVGWLLAGREPPAIARRPTE